VLILLQRRPGPTTHVTPAPREGRCRSTACFNGARVQRPGSRLATEATQAGNTYELQRSPGPTTRVTRAGTGRQRPPTCFNGARVQRPGSRPRATRSNSNASGFNGARVQRPGSHCVAFAGPSTSRLRFNGARVQRPGSPDS